MVKPYIIKRALLFPELENQNHNRVDHCKFHKSGQTAARYEVCLRDPNKKNKRYSVTRELKKKVLKFNSERNNFRTFNSPQH